MAISLYDVSVANYIQTLTAVAGFLDKGMAHCREHGIEPDDIVETRLFPDMLPFRFQVQSVAAHSLGAIEALRSGSFSPRRDLPEHDYGGLQEVIAGTLDAVQNITPEDINSLDGTEVVFRARDVERRFTAAGFILSFSLPNFHFHAATAYNILRAKGVPLGKRDYMGPLRLKSD